MLKVPIIIPGDFNCDITDQPYREDYIIDDKYKLKSLRKKEQCKRGRPNNRIDFIAVRNDDSSLFEMFIKKQKTATCSTLSSDMHNHAWFN